MLELTEEEQIILNQNESTSNNNQIEKEEGFAQLLNAYLKDTFEEQLELENVPGDGSCLYHAILLSFQRKYGKKLEIDHKVMRRKVALHMLKLKKNITYLNNYSQHENDIINVNNNSSKDNLLRERYVKYAQAHLNNTSHWPTELCIHIIATIYNLEIVVLQEQLIPGIGPLGYIIERLRTTGLESSANTTTTATTTATATVATTTATTTTATTATTARSSFVPDEERIPELIWVEDISDDDSDDEHEEMILAKIPTSAAATATNTATAKSTATATATTAIPIASSNCPFIIMIGNRGDQHYYSIGTT
jgi:hypothetical protein